MDVQRGDVLGFHNYEHYSSIGYEFQSGFMLLHNREISPAGFNLVEILLKKMFTSSYLFVKVIISILFVGRETGSSELFDEMPLPYKFIIAMAFITGRFRPTLYLIEMITNLIEK